MDTQRFDTITRLFASRRSRRAVVSGGVAIAASGLGARALAQDATPGIATPVIDSSAGRSSAGTTNTHPEFLFVQPFDGGTWAPKAETDGVYTLTLTGAAANTVYFSDRPERVVGITPTQRFLDGLGFTPEDPPNAAVVAQRETGDEQDIVVIELQNPVYDADAATLTYDARVLTDYEEDGLSYLSRQQQDLELNEAFGAGSVFIDNCTSAVMACHTRRGDFVQGITASYCWSGDVCGPLCAYPPDQCAQLYPGPCGAEDTCIAYNDEWMCSLGTCTPRNQD